MSAFITFPSADSDKLIIFASSNVVPFAPVFPTYFITKVPILMLIYSFFFLLFLFNFGKAKEERGIEGRKGGEGAMG